MHRHRRIWPSVKRSSLHARQAATAAATVKPLAWDAPSEPAVATKLNTSKWSLTPGTGTRSLGPDKPTASPVSRGETSRQGASLTNPPLFQTTVDSTSARKPVECQPASPQQRTPLSSTLSPSNSTPLTKPQQISKSPSSISLDKWARPPPPPVTSHPSRRDIASQFTSLTAQSALRTDPRLQRHFSPHRDSNVNPNIRSAHSPFQNDKHWSRQGQSSGTSQDRRNAMERTFGPRSQLDPRLSDRTTPSTPQETKRAYPAVSSSVGRSSSPSHHHRTARPHRVVHRERGSLLRTMDEDMVVSPTRSGETSSHRPSIHKTKKRTTTEKRVSADIYIPSTVSVGTLARLLGVRLERLQRRMRQAGMAEQAGYDYVLTSDYAVLLAEEFGRNPIVNDEAAFDIYPLPPSDPSFLPSRPPIVTIMGHVDHGKTTLLDTLRSASVAQGEAGGITQHIGAFSVTVPSGEGSTETTRSITFLDTPGHAAFSAMRARGADVTDIVVLVVAADDGVMPQTREVINLIKKDEGKVGVVVAINKVDKPGADIDGVQKALMAENIQLEVFGGDVPSVEVSGLTGHGLPELVETLSAIAEVQDLRAEREGLVHGFVLESKVHKGLGPVATVLVLRGCLTPGTHIISGVSSAKVRLMSDPSGGPIQAAYPGMAITVSGWKTLPTAGDEVLQGTESEVKKAVANRLRKAEIEATLADVEAINSSRRQERENRELESQTPDLKQQDNHSGPKELRLIIKADVSGSAEAVTGALQGIGNKDVMTSIISSGVGDISESDVMMAKAVGGMIVGFSVSTPRSIEILASQNDVPISSSNIIYRLMEDIRNRVIALLPVTYETRVTGEAAVLQLFDIQVKARQMKKVAGCRVVNGLIEKSKFAKVIRDGKTIHEGTLDTIRNLKKDVTEMRKGSECGLSFEGFSDLQEGDIIQMFERLEKPGVL